MNFRAVYVIFEILYTKSHFLPQHQHHNKMPYSDGEVTPNGDEFIHDDYDDEDLAVHPGATSGRSGVALRKISESLFFTEKPHNFSLVASPVKKVDNDENSFDVKLTSIFEEQPEQILGTSRLISPEKGAPSVVVSDDFFCLVADLCSRVASLEKLVHQIQSSAQGEDDACGDNNSGISSVSDDFPLDKQRKDPLDEQRKVGKRSLRHFFRLRLTRGSPATRSRVEV